MSAFVPTVLMPKNPFLYPDFRLISDSANSDGGDSGGVNNDGDNNDGSNSEGSNNEGSNVGGEDATLLTAKEPPKSVDDVTVVAVDGI